MLDRIDSTIRGFDDFVEDGEGRLAKSERSEQAKGKHKTGVTQGKGRRSARIPLTRDRLSMLHFRRSRSQHHLRAKPFRRDCK